MRWIPIACIATFRRSWHRDLSIFAQLVAGLPRALFPPPLWMKKRGQDSIGLLGKLIAENGARVNNAREILRCAHRRQRLAHGNKFFARPSPSGLQTEIGQNARWQIPVFAPHHRFQRFARTLKKFRPGGTIRVNQPHLAHARVFVRAKFWTAVTRRGGRGQHFNYQTRRAKHALICIECLLLFASFEVFWVIDARISPCYSARAQHVHFTS